MFFHWLFSYFEYQHSARLAKFLLSKELANHLRGINGYRSLKKKRTKRTTATMSDGFEIQIFFFLLYMYCSILLYEDIDIDKREWATGAARIEDGSRRKFGEKQGFSFSRNGFSSSRDSQLPTFCCIYRKNVYLVEYNIYSKYNKYKHTISSNGA